MNQFSYIHWGEPPVMNTVARRLALLMVALLIVAVPPTEGWSAGKHNQANTGCTCHQNGGGITATHNFPSTYMAGMMYSISIGHTGGTQAFNGGFNVLVDKGNLMNAGSGVQIDTVQKSATHTSQGQLGWSFDWMAPVGGSGSVTVHVAVLQSDASGNNNGDAWNRLSFTIAESAPPNDPPEASNVTVTPSTNNEAPTNATLTLTYDYYDMNDNPEGASTIQWYVDGVVNTAHDGKTSIQPSQTQPGQKWKAEVTPYDGTEYGTAEMSNEVTIIDIDSDGDGVFDGQDAFPNDPNEDTDSDGDGVGDNGDWAPNDSSETADTDNDGVGDNADVFPNDPSETADTDNDGVGDNADVFPNDPSETADADNDGVGDNADRFDDDPTESADSDNDGVGDNADAFPNHPGETTDSDGDGVGDNGDAFPNDPTETVDSDEDGVGDNADAFPTDPFESADTDMDGVGDNADAFDDDATQTTDRDGDGYGDNADGNNPDAFPEDETEWMDTDGDTYGDNSDAFPTDATQWADQDGDGYGDNPQGTTPDMFKTDATQWADTDNDGYGDNPSGTNADLFPTDSTEWFDTDGDGVGDNGDAFPNDASETKDSDGDGMGDNAQAIYEAELAAQQEEEDAAARMRMIIGVVLVLLVGAGAGVFYMRSRSGAEGDEVAKDFSMPDMNAQPAAASTGYDPMSTAGYGAQPAQSYDSMAGYGAQPAATASDPMATQTAMQPVDDSALNALVEPEPVAAAAVSMPEAVVAAQPAVVAPAEPTVVNQWTDDNGHTWRVMSDGTNRWWNGTDWQKV